MAVLEQAPAHRRQPEREIDRSTGAVVRVQPAHVVGQRVERFGEDDAEHVGVELGPRQQHRRDLGIAGGAGRVGQRGGDLGAVIVERQPHAGEPRGDQLVEVAGARQAHAVGADEHAREAAGPGGGDEPRQLGVHGRLAADEIDRGRAAGAEEPRRGVVEEPLDVGDVEQPRVGAAMDVAVHAADVAERSGVDVHHREHPRVPVAVLEAHAGAQRDDVVAILVGVAQHLGLGQHHRIAIGERAGQRGLGGAITRGAGRRRERHHHLHSAQRARRSDARARLRERAVDAGVGVVTGGVDGEQLHHQAIEAGGDQPAQERRDRQRTAVGDQRDRGGAGGLERADLRGQLAAQRGLAVADHHVLTAHVGAAIVGLGAGHARLAAVVAGAVVVGDAHQPRMPAAAVDQHRQPDAGARGCGHRDFAARHRGDRTAFMRREDRAAARRSTPGRRAPPAPRPGRRVARPARSLRGPRGGDRTAGRRSPRRAARRG